MESETLNVQDGTTNMTKTDAKRKKSAVDAPRANLFLMDPENLVLITDKKHPLYDPRVEWPVSDSMVASVMAKGVIEPVIVRKEGSEIVVIDGRQRTKAALEANKRLRAEGAPTVRVPTIVRREEDAEAFSTSVVLNEIRQADDVLTKAQKAQKLLNMGRSEKEVAADFGVTTVSIKNWLAVLELAPEVRKAVSDDLVSAHDAVKTLGKLDREEQVKGLSKLIESAPAKRSRTGKDEKPKKKVSPVGRLRSIYRNEEVMNALSKREQALIGWIFGKVTKGDLVESIPRLGDLI
jgi:ParB family chromosome partitioning protein